MVEYVPLPERKDMKKALLIIGVPGTGKTTLTRKIMQELEATGWAHKPTPEKVKYLPFKEYVIDTKESRVSCRFLGVFSDNPTTYAEGTDKLSMGVQPFFEVWVGINSSHLVIEGDRLANVKTLEALLKNRYEVHVMVLDANENTLQARYKKRGSNQSETFLKGRATKVDNLRRAAMSLGLTVSRDMNSNLTHQENLVHNAIEFLEN